MAKTEDLDYLALDEIEGHSRSDELEKKVRLAIKDGTFKGIIRKVPCARK